MLEKAEAYLCLRTISLPPKKSVRFLKKFISFVLAVTFFTTSIDLALASEVARQPAVSTLAPTSSFKPIVSIVRNDDGTYRIVENDPSVTGLDVPAKDAPPAVLGAFKEVAGFMYLSGLMGDALKLNLSADGLRQLIRRDLPHVDFADFRCDRLYKTDGAFYLPYTSKVTGTGLLLRYSLSDKTVLFPDATVIDRDGERQVVFETIPADDADRDEQKQSATAGGKKRESVQVRAAKQDFIDFIRSNFDRLIRSDRALSVLDVGTGARPDFCYRVKGALEGNGIRVKVFGIEPGLESTLNDRTIAEAAKSGIILERGYGLEDLDPAHSAVIGVQKFDIIFINAPSFDCTSEEMVGKMRERLAPGGLVVITYLRGDGGALIRQADRELLTIYGAIDVYEQKLTGLPSSDSFSNLGISVIARFSETEDIEEPAGNDRNDEPWSGGMNPHDLYEKVIRHANKGNPEAIKWLLAYPNLREQFDFILLNLNEKALGPFVQGVWLDAYVAQELKNFAQSYAYWYYRAQQAPEAVRTVVAAGLACNGIGETHHPLLQSLLEGSNPGQPRSPPEVSDREFLAGLAVRLAPFAGALAPLMQDRNQAVDLAEKAHTVMAGLLASRAREEEYVLAGVGQAVSDALAAAGLVTGARLLPPCSVASSGVVFTSDKESAIKRYFKENRRGSIFQRHLLGKAVADIVVVPVIERSGRDRIVQVKIGEIDHVQAHLLGDSVKSADGFIDLSLRLSSDAVHLNDISVHGSMYDDPRRVEKIIVEAISGVLADAHFAGFLCKQTAVDLKEVDWGLSYFQSEIDWERAKPEVVGLAMGSASWATIFRKLGLIDDAHYAQLATGLYPDEAEKVLRRAMQTEGVAGSRSYLRYLIDRIESYARHELEREQPKGMVSPALVAEKAHHLYYRETSQLFLVGRIPPRPAPHRPAPPGSIPSVFRTLLNQAEPLTSTEIARELGRKRSTIAPDVAALTRDLHLVERVGRGKNIQYQVAPFARRHGRYILQLLQDKLYAEHGLHPSREILGNFGRAIRTICERYDANNAAYPSDRDIDPADFGLTDEEYALYRAIPDVSLVIVSRSIFLSHQDQTSTLHKSFGADLFAVATQLNMDIARLEAVLNVMANKINDAMRHNVLLRAKYRATFAAAYARYLYAHFHQPVIDGREPGIEVDSALATGASMASRRTLVFGAGVQGVRYITETCRTGKLVLVDINPFVCDLLRTYALLACAPDVSVVQGDIADLSIAGEFDGVCDLVFMHRTLHEAGRMTDVAVEREANQEQIVSITSPQAIAARRRTYRNCERLLAPGGIAIIGEAASQEGFTADSVTAEIGAQSGLTIIDRMANEEGRDFFLYMMKPPTSREWPIAPGSMPAVFRLLGDHPEGMTIEAIAAALDRAPGTIRHDRGMLGRLRLIRPIVRDGAVVYVLTDGARAKAGAIQKLLNAAYARYGARPSGDAVEKGLVPAINALLSVARCIDPDKALLSRLYSAVDAVDGSLRLKQAVRTAAVIAREMGRGTSAWPGYDQADRVRWHDFSHAATMALRTIETMEQVRTDKPSVPAAATFLAGVAALCHDLGYYRVDDRGLGTIKVEHEKRSIHFVRENASRLGLTVEETELVAMMIGATKMAVEPVSWDDLERSFSTVPGTVSPAVLARHGMGVGRPVDSEMVRGAVYGARALGTFDLYDTRPDAFERIADLDTEYQDDCRRLSLLLAGGDAALADDIARTAAQVGAESGALARDAIARGVDHTRAERAADELVRLAAITKATVAEQQGASVAFLRYADERVRGFGIWKRYASERVRSAFGRYRARVEAAYELMLHKTGARATAEAAAQTRSRGERQPHPEAVRAAAFVDTVKIVSHDIAGREKPETAVVGIEIPRWLPKNGQLRRAIQPLLVELARVEQRLRKGGITNISFVYGEGRELARLVKEKRQEVGAPLKNTVIIASEKTIGQRAFRSLRSRPKHPGAFFAAVDPEELGDMNHIRLLEMLTIALKLAFGEEVAAVDHPFIGIEEIGERIIRLIPRAEPLSYDELKHIYESQRQALIAA